MQKVVSNSTVKANIAPISLADAPDSSDQLQQLQLLMGLSLADELEEKTSRCVFVVVKRCEPLNCIYRLLEQDNTRSARSSSPSWMIEREDYKS